MKMEKIRKELKKTKKYIKTKKTILKNELKNKI